MKPATIEKVNGLGKAGYILANIAKVLICIALVIVLLFTVVSFVIPSELLSFHLDTHAAIDIDCGTLGITADQLYPDELNAAMAEENVIGNLTIQGMDILFDGVSVSGDTVTVSGAGNATLYGIGMIRIMLLMALLSMAVYLVCAFFIAGFCKALSQCKTPFEAELVKKMQTLAWAMLALPFISSLTDSLTESALSGNIHIQLSIDLMEVILILAMFSLSYIFKYGAQLQQESDETL